METLTLCRTLDELEALVRAYPGVYVRYSAGPRHDADELSVDGESGLELPGLSVNPLTRRTGGRGRCRTGSRVS